MQRAETSSSINGSDMAQYYFEFLLFNSSSLYESAMHRNFASAQFEFVRLLRSIGDVIKVEES